MSDMILCYHVKVIVEQQLPYRVFPLRACVESAPLVSFPVVDETLYSDWDCSSENRELVDTW